MRREEPERELFIAVTEKLYDKFFVHPDVIELIETQHLKFLIFDEKNEVVVQWKN